jgi:hypothetical protein
MYAPQNGMPMLDGKEMIPMFASALMFGSGNGPLKGVGATDVGNRREEDRKSGSGSLGNPAT